MKKVFLMGMCVFVLLVGAACAQDHAPADVSGGVAAVEGAPALGFFAQTPVPVAQEVSVYSVKYVDQDGNPVAGVMCQVCSETVCQVYFSDEAGVCAFELAPYAWEIHTLMTPEGYTGDTQTVTVAPVEGGEMTFVLTKNEAV